MNAITLFWEGGRRSDSEYSWEYKVKGMKHRWVRGTWNGGALVGEGDMGIGG